MKYFKKVVYTFLLIVSVFCLGLVKVNATTVLHEVNVTLDESQFDFNTSKTEGQLQTWYNNNITGGEGVYITRHWLSYKVSETSYYGVGDGNENLSTTREYYYRYDVMPSAGYEFAADAVYKFNGVEVQRLNNDDYGARAHAVTTAQYSISYDGINKNFGNKAVGYSPISPVSYTATNNGTGTITNYKVEVSNNNFVLSGTTSMSVMEPGDSFTYSVKPKDGLAVGVYSANVTVSGDGIEPRTIIVSLKVSNELDVVNITVPNYAKIFSTANTEGEVNQVICNQAFEVGLNANYYVDLANSGLRTKHGPMNFYGIYDGTDHMSAEKDYYIKLRIVPDGDYVVGENTVIRVNGVEQTEIDGDSVYYDVNYEVTDGVSNLRWDGKTATWNQFGTSTQYWLVLLKNGEEITVNGTEKPGAVDGTSYNLTNLIKANGSGKYTFRVFAYQGTGAESLTTTSGISDSIYFSAPPTSVTWSIAQDSYEANWSNVEGAQYYKVILYKDDEAVNERTEYDIFTSYTSYIENNPGKYKFCVKAFYEELSEEKCSAVFEYSDAPTGLEWDETIARWDPVEHATNYWVELFNGSEMIFNDYVGNMNNTDFTDIIAEHGDGEYRFTVAAKISVIGVKSSTSPANVVHSYTITVDEAEHGSVSVDKETYIKGETINITVNADPGYKLDYIVMYDEFNPLPDGLGRLTEGANKITLDNPINIKAFFVKDEKLPFSDTKEGTWYYESVKGAYTRGIIKGYDNGLFGVNDKITRGQLVVILYRLEGEVDVSTFFNPFDDVKAGAYYENAIRWAYANHIVSGYANGDFGPNDNIKRKDFAVILNNYAKYKSLSVTGSAELTGFEDYEKVQGNYSEPALKWAVANKIVNGAEKDGKRYLNPNDNATRAEASAMIMNFINKYNL